MRPLILITALLLATPAAGQWVDNGDDTWTLSATTSAKRLTMACARLTLNLPADPADQELCDQAAADALKCPNTAVGTLTPRRTPQLCKDADVSPGRCTQSEADNASSWLVTLIRCGDGTFGGASGIAPDMDYDRWPGGTENNAEEYDAICKTKWKNKAWWVPAAEECRAVLKRKQKANENALVLGGGEKRIIRQGDEIAEETEAQ